MLRRSLRVLADPVFWLGAWITSAVQALVTGRWKWALVFFILAFIMLAGIITSFISHDRERVRND